MVSEAVRMRVIRALLGWEAKEMARRINVNPHTVTSWERGRTTPNSINRKVLSEILLENNIAIRPDGFPVPSGQYQEMKFIPLKEPQ